MSSELLDTASTRARLLRLYLVLCEEAKLNPYVFPTAPELAKLVGLSVAYVQVLTSKLRRAGFIVGNGQARRVVPGKPASDLDAIAPAADRRVVRDAAGPKRERLDRTGWKAKAIAKLEAHLEYHRGRATFHEQQADLVDEALRNLEALDQGSQIDLRKLVQVRETPSSVPAGEDVLLDEGDDELACTG